MRICAVGCIKLDHRKRHYSDPIYCFPKENASDVTGFLKKNASAVLENTPHATLPLLTATPHSRGGEDEFCKPIDSAPPRNMKRPCKPKVFSGAAFCARCKIDGVGSITPSVVVGFAHQGANQQLQ